MGMTSSSGVKQDVIDLIPNSYQFDQSHWKRSGDDLAGTLDDAASHLDDEGQITDQDLRESDDGSNDAEEEDFDRARDTITQSDRIWRPLARIHLALVAIVSSVPQLERAACSGLCVSCSSRHSVFVILVGVARAVAPLDERIVDPPKGEDATLAGIRLADTGDENCAQRHRHAHLGPGGQADPVPGVLRLAIAGVIVWAMSTGDAARGSHRTTLLARHPRTCGLLSKPASWPVLSRGGVWPFGSAFAGYVVATTGHGSLRVDRPAVRELRPFPVGPLI